mgnify:CR=1 FL=1
MGFSFVTEIPSPDVIRERFPLAPELAARKKERDEEIKKIVLGQRDIVEKAEKLIDTANGNGGKDNITVVLIEPFSDEVKEC